MPLDTNARAPVTRTSFNGYSLDTRLSFFASCARKPCPGEGVRGRRATGFAEHSRSYVRQGLVRVMPTGHFPHLRQLAPCSMLPTSVKPGAHAMHE